MLPLRAFCLALLVAAAPAAAQSELTRESPEARLEQLVDTLDAMAMFNGRIVIDRGGIPVQDVRTGYADYAYATEFDDETRFRIASLSKVYTDALVAVLIEEGRMSMDDPLSDYLPDFPNAARITIGQLVRHQSGIAHTNRMEWGDGSQSLTRDEIVERLAGEALDFEPGAETRYSNGGYTVLTAAIEVATGESFADTMQHNVLGPLGLDNTGFITDSRAVMPGLARGYEPGPVAGSRRESRFYAVEARPGGGDMYATMDDVRRFFAALYRDGFPGPAGQSAVFGSPGATRGMTGRSPGFYAVVHYNIANDLLVVSLANNYAADFAWGQTLAAIAMGDASLLDVLPEAARETGAPDTDMLGSFRYENPNYSQTLEISANEDGSLSISDLESGTRTALIAAEGGGYIETLFFGICHKVETDRISCSRFYDGGFTADLVRR